MGSINDYLRSRRRMDDQPRAHRIKTRLLGQISLSLVLFLIIAASIQADNFLGDSARYVAGEGVAASSSWIDFSGESQQDTTEPLDDPNATAVQNVCPSDDSAQPDFTAPASGIVVTDIAVEAGGFATKQGILIQGNAGQSVKAAAAGSIASLDEGTDGMVMEITHSGGFTSVYQGLSDVDVSVGDQVNTGDLIGTTADGELTFSLLLNGTEVNPLEYLFE